MTWDGLSILELIICIYKALCQIGVTIETRGHGTTREGLEAVQIVEAVDEGVETLVGLMI